MGPETVEEAHEARAQEFANRCILFGAEGDRPTAQQAWQDALAYAEQHLPGNQIIPWIQSGLGASLLRNAIIMAL